MTLIRPPGERSTRGEDPPERLLSAEEAYALEGAADAVYEEFVSRRWRELCAFASACLKSADDAEDIAQEAVIAAWEKGVSKRFDGDERRLFMYVLTSINNRTLNEHRRRGRLAKLSAGVASLLQRLLAPETPQDYTISREFEGLLEDAFRALPPACRKAFVMVRVFKMSYEETAEALQISKKTVNSYVQTANRRFAKRLGAAGYTGLFTPRGRVEEDMQ